MPKQRGGGSVISFCTMCKGGGGGLINFQLSLGVGHPILLRKHAHILSIKKRHLKLCFQSSVKSLLYFLKAILMQ